MWPACADHMTLLGVVPHLLTTQAPRDWLHSPPAGSVADSTPPTVTHTSTWNKLMKTMAQTRAACAGPHTPCTNTQALSAYGTLVKCQSFAHGVLCCSIWLLHGHCDNSGDGLVHLGTCPLPANLQVEWVRVVSQYTHHAWVHTQIHNTHNRRNVIACMYHGALYGAQLHCDVTS